MATTTGKTHCATCGKGKIAYKCEGCSQYFCIIDLLDHHQGFSKELDEIKDKSHLFQETLIEQRKNPHKHSLIQQINQWEEDSIHKIQQTAEEARQLLLEHTGQNINLIEKKLTRLTNELGQTREENDFNEINLNEFKQKLEQLEEQLNKPSNISIRQDFSLFIMKISVLTTPNSLISDTSSANTTTTTTTTGNSNQDDSYEPTDEQAKNFVKVFSEAKKTNTNKSGEENTSPLASSENKTTTKKQTDAVKNDAKISASQTPSSFGSSENVKFSFTNAEKSQPQLQKQTSTSLNNTNSPIFGGAPSLKPSANTNSGFSFPNFGNISSTGFQFSTLATTTEAASANKLCFGNPPKFSFSDLAKQTSSNDKLTNNGTEKRVFAGQGSLIFGTSSANTTTTTENNNEDDAYEPNISLKPIVQLSAVEVKTDEEDENVLFCERGKLYRFDSEANQMKERGIGEMKILQHKTTNFCRILMRHEQVLKLCANHQITSQMELKPHQGSAIAYVWSAMDFADGNAKHEILCIRFTSNDIAKRFVTQFNDAKQANANSSQ